MRAPTPRTHDAADVTTGDDRKAVGSAHGKAILLGEHAVVYGAPAVAVPLTQITVAARARLRTAASEIVSDLYRGAADAALPALAPTVAALETALAEIGQPAAVVEITSSIPHSRGLGSSAAVAAAVVEAVTRAGGLLLTPERRHELIQVAETIAHGRPSGLDAHAVVADGAIGFERGIVTPVPLTVPLPLVIADSGHAGRTSEAVARVRARREANPERVDAMLAQLAAGPEAVAELGRGDLAAVGARMDASHRLLAELGVSSADLDTLARAARAAGALGAKLTGGGIGGCVIGLARSAEELPALADALAAAGAAAVRTTVVAAA